MPEEETKSSFGPLSEYVARPFEIGAIDWEKKKTKLHQYCIHLLASVADDIDPEQRENRANELQTFSQREYSTHDLWVIDTYRDGEKFRH